MKVSVLLAGCRSGRYLAPALASVRDQSHAGWELLVAEDGPHVETRDVVAAFGRTVPQAVRYESAGASGAAAARNHLLQRADGDAIAFIEPDDRWDDDHLATGVARIERGADVVVTGVRTHELASGRELSSYHPDPTLADDPAGTLFRRPAILTCSSVIFTRRLVALTGGFDPELRVGDDRDFWLRAALTGARFVIAPSYTCHHARLSGNTFTQTLTLAEQSVRFYRKHRHLRAVPSAVRRQHLAQSCLAHAQLSRRSDPRGALALLLQAFRLTPLEPAVWRHLASTGVALARTAAAR